MTPAVRLANLSFSYSTPDGGEVPVLKNVNLEIGEGELVAIQGPSGSGKSTLLYLIGGLMSTYRGTVEVFGNDLSELDDGRLAQLRNQTIGFVFQHFHLLGRATVLENILLPSRYPAELPPREGAEATARALAAQVDLSTRTDRLPNQLSGGQQQRVAIARALLNPTRIILADEPTGSLDTKNSARIIELLKAAHREGRTVIIITHDPNVARQCDRTIHVRDGEITEDSGAVASGSAIAEGAAPGATATSRASRITFARTWRITRTQLPTAIQNLRRNRTRSALTMLGIVIGVAAVLSTITLGSFTKRKLLDSYAEMGVNTLVFSGYPNWKLRATDKATTVFRGFDFDRDIRPLKTIFPEIVRSSPSMSSYNNTVTFGGQSIDQDVQTFGVSTEGLDIINRRTALGAGFSPYHVENRSAVCVIGFDIYRRLFANVSPLGQIAHVGQRDSSFACRVIGVLTPQTSNKEWNKPNLAVFVPYTFFQATTEPWNAHLREVLLKGRPGGDVEKLGRKIKAFFKQRYGPSAQFEVGSDSVLITQMNKLLSLFSVLLAGIAVICLAVGGIGITNMMLVSVNERYKEIGVCKAFGATNFSVRVQFLLESLIICGFAGTLGLVVGFVLYEGAIFGATKFIPTLQFEWTAEPLALVLSVSSIFLVGLLSGLTPALKAERLQVIEALRSE